MCAGRQPDTNDSELLLTAKDGVSSIVRPCLTDLHRPHDDAPSSRGAWQAQLALLRHLRLSPAGASAPFGQERAGKPGSESEESIGYQYL